MPDGNPNQTDLESRKLEFERYKAQLDYRKFIWGSVFVAIAIAAIPPSFQLATAVLEYVKTQAKLQIDKQSSDADRLTKQEEFHQSYIKDFLANALNQDIELRIRFAEYFAYVSAGKFQDGWVKYHGGLVGHRGDIRNKIDQMEGDWQTKAQAQARTPEIDRIERNLAWLYKEVGYVEKNRSVAANPRAPDRRSPDVTSLRNPAACDLLLNVNFKGAGKRASEEDYRQVAATLEIETALLLAFSDVISGARAFLPDGRPTAYFVPTSFARYSSTGLPQTGSGGLPPNSPGSLNQSPVGDAAEYDRMKPAIEIDCPAALKATRWGVMGILGYSHNSAGFPYLDDFVRAAMDSERAQLDQFASYLQANSNVMLNLKNKDWLNLEIFFCTTPDFGTKLAAAYDARTKAKP